MTNGSGSRGFLSGRLGPIIVAVVVTGLVVFVACFAGLASNLGGGAWRGEVSVMEAVLRYPDRDSISVSPPATGHQECRCCGRRTSTCRLR